MSYWLADPEGPCPQMSDESFVLQKQILGQIGKLITLCKSCEKEFSFRSSGGQNPLTS